MRVSEGFVYSELGAVATVNRKHLAPRGAAEPLASSVRCPVGRQRQAATCGAHGGAVTVLPVARAAPLVFLQQHLLSVSAVTAVLACRRDISVWLCVSLVADKAQRPFVAPWPFVGLLGTRSFRSSTNL